ncbi:hypothetical protein [Actinomadura sp. HBU206391]|uniref:hypothetical protein n=1 Tax=Actinomadura sp. HBU206391 TaxID=2731692 RepID=UPI00164EDF7B|nr:hypothetical protein [Actinomadura sp. HBU206391]
MRVADQMPSAPTSRSALAVCPPAPVTIRAPVFGGRGGGHGRQEVGYVVLPEVARPAERSLVELRVARVQVRPAVDEKSYELRLAPPAA